MSIPSELVEQAMALPEADRIELAHLLLEGVSNSEQREPGYEEAWAVELERRARAIDEGTATLLSWGEVREMMEHSLAEHRKSPPTSPRGSG